MNARTVLARVRPGLAGAARVVTAAAVSAGLVWGATAHPVEVDLAAATGAAEESAARTSLATSLAAMCPGNELSGIPGVEDVTVGGTVTAATGPDELLPVEPEGTGSAGLGAGSAPLAELAPARPATASADLPRSGPVALDARGAAAPAVVGTQEWLRATDDLRGLVTTPCRVATTDLWLLGGGAGPGRQERLVLTNPGGNPVTATITVHGAAGPVGSSRSTSVPPGGRVTLLLDAIAPDEATPAVHVVAGGGGLHATLTDTWLEGSTPLGAETVVPAADPAPVQVVPAAVLGTRAAVRVAVPGEEEAVASVSLLGPDGEVPGSEDSVLRVPGGTVAELPLPTVDRGNYGVVVKADVPVVAAVRTETRGESGPGDIGWSVAAPAVTAVGGTALPATADVVRSLRVVSTGGASTARVLLVVDGQVRVRTVELGSEESADVALSGASAVWVRRLGGGGELRGGVVSASGPSTGLLLSVMPLGPAPVTSPVSRAFPLP
ncbi:hypothetical protein JQN72_17005 [Phycicoccus sp. CSK15P-2]|uniref:DUF5719 family protein n=1 Tax=Phycicoccus sp. CSK15P-2 TaxID=2807627 RepID=UPI00194F29CE|nr:DUF5719 family protein [Phycicoccus sp. CSK15P-2]MBM6405943.1 hypothetical protein [Phycicoccus sp. CSK15P-2]